MKCFLCVQCDKTLKNGEMTVHKRENVLYYPIIDLDTNKLWGLHHIGAGSWGVDPSECKDCILLRKENV